MDWSFSLNLWQAYHVMNVTYSLRSITSVCVFRHRGIVGELRCVLQKYLRFASVIYCNVHSTQIIPTVCENAMKNDVNACGDCSSGGSRNLGVLSKNFEWEPFRSRHSGYWKIITNVKLPHITWYWYAMFIYFLISFPWFFYSSFLCSTHIMSVSLRQGLGTNGLRTRYGSFDDGIWLAWYFLNTIVTNETFSVIFQLPDYKAISNTIQHQKPQ